MEEGALPSAVRVGVEQQVGDGSLSSEVRVDMDLPVHDPPLPVSHPVQFHDKCESCCILCHHV